MTVGSEACNSPGPRELNVAGTHPVPLCAGPSALAALGVSAVTLTTCGSSSSASTTTTAPSSNGE